MSDKKYTISGAGVISVDSNQIIRSKSGRMKRQLDALKEIHELREDKKARSKVAANAR